jgi:DNA-binding LacI/PurR family transcriptional regulator
LAEAEHLLRAKPNGIFACNDRLAEALITHCRKSRVPLPPLVGFDNAPVAEHLRLTTIGIPWQAMVSHAVTLIAARLEGNAESARLVSLSHEPILRLTA